SLLANLTVMREQVLGMRDSAADAGSDRIGMAGQLGEWVDIIDESIASIAHVRSIVRELRNFSRTEGSTVGRVDLNRVVDDACKLTESVIRKRARLVKRLGAVSKIRGDHGKLVQVVTNLLTNAAQAIAGQVADNEIRVSTAERDGLIIAAVEDTGCGIPEGASKLVFEPFFTTKPRDVGNGLGLALSAEIVDGHGGELGFAPVAGGGTRFEVRLPVDRQVAGDTLELHRPVRLAPRAQVAAGPRSRVLLIDDEPSLLRAFRRLLSPYHEVVMAATGQQALDILIRDSAFDGIICDFALPDVDGIAIYENVAARDRELAERIVFCTGGPLSGRSRVFIESTRNTVLDKPVPPEVLIGAIEQLGTR
ncbi:MAG: hybrid sensor histidine kinase/response regulator, partial [Myxococcota bacterium]